MASSVESNPVFCPILKLAGLHPQPASLSSAISHQQLSVRATDCAVPLAAVARNHQSGNERVLVPPLPGKPTPARDSNSTELQPVFAEMAS